MEGQHKYEVILTPQPDGGVTVSVPDLPDVVTEADTREDALAMAKDAIEGYLEAMRDHGWGIPVPVHERVLLRALRATAPRRQDTTTDPGSDETASSPLRSVPVIHNADTVGFESSTL